jgi:hypothetical protein
MIPTPRTDAALCERFCCTLADLPDEMRGIIKKATEFYEKVRAMERELAIAMDENAFLQGELKKLKEEVLAGRGMSYLHGIKDIVKKV